MNTLWSTYVQGCDTLYYSRRLRFDDAFAERYCSLFSLDREKPLRILEIGCGPGALAGALLRWYPNASVVGVDRDSNFIKYARAHEKGVEFIEADACALPFEEGEFDVTISNTVSEHIEPSAFFGEQYRVLKRGGICIVISSRKGILSRAECLADDRYEIEFWEKVKKYDETFEVCEVCKYPMTESELPSAFEKYGFGGVSTGYVTVDLTPDDPKYSGEKAQDIINADRYGELDAISSVEVTLGKHIKPLETQKMRELINAKYDKRLDDYKRGIKHWDTNVSVMMVIKGTK